MRGSSLKRLFSRTLALATTLAFLGSLGACVDEVGLVDRTKSDGFEKGLFEGVWAYTQTTVDAPYSTAMSFTGHMNFGGSAKIIFDIQEDSLVAYPVIETVGGTEKGYKMRKIRKYWDPDHRDEFMEIYTAQPMAIWRITKHYDVIRKYDAYNGAQSNELVEDTEDRPWYMRDRIKVEWHSNVVAPFFFRFAGGVESSSTWEGQDDEVHPDDMAIDKEGGYFDYVVKTRAAASRYYWCSIYGLSPYDCEPAEVKVRHSFRRFDPRRDYEPLRYHNNEHQDKFGYFLTDRPTYDADWGTSYEGKTYFANRHNLWMNTYDFVKPLDDEGNDITLTCLWDDECDQAAGQRCQKSTSWFDEGYCATPVAKPYAERGMRPIIFHLNADWHPDYMEAAYDTADGWSDAYKEAVSWQLFYEEHGVASVRGCVSDGDCEIGDALLVDMQIAVTYDGIPCHQDSECCDPDGAAEGLCSSYCGEAGFCSVDRPCGPNVGCASGQLCELQPALETPVPEPTVTCGPHVTEVIGACIGADKACQTIADCGPPAPDCEGCTVQCIDADAGVPPVMGICNDPTGDECASEADCDLGVPCTGYIPAVDPTDGTCEFGCRGDSFCSDGATCEGFVDGVNGDLDCILEVLGTCAVGADVACLDDDACAPIGCSDCGGSCQGTVAALPEVLGTCDVASPVACAAVEDCAPPVDCVGCGVGCVGVILEVVEVLGACNDASALPCSADSDCTGAACQGYVAPVNAENGTCVTECREEANCEGAAACLGYGASADAVEGICQTGCRSDFHCGSDGSCDAYDAGERCLELHSSDLACTTTCGDNDDCNRKAHEVCLNLTGQAGRGYCTALCDVDDDCDQAAGEHCSIADGQSAGQCRLATCHADGAPVQKVIGTSQRGSTVIYHGGGTIVTHDNFSSDLENALNGNSYVRFVHADPDGGPLGLNVNGIDIVGGAYGAGGDLDPQDPGTADFMAQIPAGTSMSFQVISGGVTVDGSTTLGDLVPNSTYLAIWNGKNIVVIGSNFSDSKRGIRFIHAASGEGKVDFAVSGVRLAKAVGYRQATPYEYNTWGATQRVTVTRAGSRGDLTCYQADAIGRCVGWPMDLTEAHHARRQEIKDEMAELFVLCENQYDPVAATDEANLSPSHFGDGRYTKKIDGGTFYNPCGDTELVAHPEELKKIGDLRYSWFYWVNEMQRAGPLGYGPSVADPDTGEIVAGFANIYGGAIHTYGQWAADLLALVNGDLDTSEIVTGEWVRKSMAAKTGDDGAANKTLFGGMSNASAPTTDSDIKGMLEQALGLEHGHTLDAKARVSSLMGAPVRPGTDTDFPEFLEFLGNPDAFREMIETEFPPLEPTYYHDRLGKIRGTVIEDMMVNNEVLLAAPGFEMEGIEGDDLHAALSPASWASKYAMRKEEQRMQVLAQNNMYMADFVDDALWGLAHELKYTESGETTLTTTECTAATTDEDCAAYGWGCSEVDPESLKSFCYTGTNTCQTDADCPGAPGGCSPADQDTGVQHCYYTYPEIRLEVSRRILRGVLEHEVGHTVGLRHNFSASTDVFNFLDPYYEVREKEVILCQDDDWCDILGSQRCAFTECTSDDDCIIGMVCFENSCSAPSSTDLTDLQPTGVCSMPVADTNCTSSDECEGETLCVEGTCFAPREQLAPRTWLTEIEKRDKRTEYQYTSVMDYGGRFNSDVHGLGKYDYAAIRFGYTQLVDTYQDPSHLRKRVADASATYGTPLTQNSWYLNTRWWSNRGIGFWHSFRYLNDYIGVEQNLDRVPRPYEQVKYQHEMVRNDVRNYLDFESIEVNYAFCSDEYRGNMGCYYFDLGIDAGEMAAHSRDQLEQYYIFDAFKRERLYYGRYGSPMGYFGRIMDRYLRVLGDVGMYFAFYDTLLFRYAWYDWWQDSPLGGRTLKRAAHNSFGYLQDVVSSPAPGSYKYDETKDAYVNISLEPGHEESEFEVPLGVGRYPYTQFGQSAGYLFFEHPLWFGSFWEKMGALLTLTDSTAYFVDASVGEQLNIGVGTSLGYNTIFADEMNLFLGSMIAGNTDKYAGRVIQGKFAPFSVAKKQDDPFSVAVEPALNNFTLKLYAAAFGLAYLPAGYDPRFIDSTAVFLEGEATHFAHEVMGSCSDPLAATDEVISCRSDDDCFDLGLGLCDGYEPPPSGVTEFRFEDPIGGKVYVAYRNNYGAFDTEKVYAGATLIEKANDLADQWQDATGVERSKLEQDLHDVREVLDLLRRLNHIYGASTLGL